MLLQRSVRNVCALCLLKQRSLILSARLTSGGNILKIERMSFLVQPPEKVKDFVDADEQMWGPWLRQQRGFIQKTVTTHPGGRVELHIFWDDKQSQVNAANNPELPIIEATFRNIVGPIYHLLYAD